MNRNESIGIGTGSVSILAIFVVLCLTTLSALSFVSARADYVLAQKTADSAAEYYEADAKAEEMLSTLLSYARSGSGWEESAAAEGYTVTHVEGGIVVNYAVPISPTKNLFVEVELEADGNGQPTGLWDRTIWQTQIVDTEGIDQSMNVLQ